MSDEWAVIECLKCGDYFSNHLGACPKCEKDYHERRNAIIDDLRKPVEKVQKGAKEPSPLEQAFIAAWALTGLEMPVTEYRFCMTRRWRADFAWPEKKVIVELMGGGYNYGRHHRPQGYKNDCEKHNMAIELGWRVLQYTEVSNDMIEQIKRVLSQ